MRPNPQHIPSAAPTPGPGRPVGNPWIGVRFTCAGAYIRVYRKPTDTQYVARCPKCMQCIRFRVGPGGHTARQFDVSC
jgi:hypothetical protein